MSGEIAIRKILTVMEETREEQGVRLEKLVRKAAAIAVIKNPFVGRYVQDISLLFDYGEKLGDLLVHTALKALGITPEEAKERVDGYGKGAVVGLAGEIEHPHAILHPKFGAPVRRALGGLITAKP